MPHNEISDRGGLTFPAKAWSSSVMTQRNIHRTHHATANPAARTAARAIALRCEIASQRALPNVVWIHTALATLVLVVVVLITTPTGAG